MTEAGDGVSEIRGGATTHPPLMVGARLQTLLASSREQRHKLAGSQKRGEGPLGLCII